MGDLASDHDAAIELVISGYRKLRDHNPNHELLQYISNVSDAGFHNVPDKTQEFLDRFESEEDKRLSYIKVARVLANFYVALKNASDEIEGVINRKVKASSPVKQLDELKDEDYPF